MGGFTARGRGEDAWGIGGVSRSVSWGAGRGREGCLSGPFASGGAALAGRARVEKSLAMGLRPLRSRRASSNVSGVGASGGGGARGPVSVIRGCFFGAADFSPMAARNTASSSSMGPLGPFGAGLGAGFGATGAGSESSCCFNLARSCFHTISTILDMSRLGHRRAGPKPGVAFPHRKVAKHPAQP